MRVSNMKAYIKADGAGRGKGVGTIGLQHDDTGRLGGNRYQRREVAGKIRRPPNAR